MTLPSLESKFYEELWSTTQLRAYAPYSKHKVGAAIIDYGGEVTLGFNVENASYGMTLCAERLAMANFVIQGGLSLYKIVVASPSPVPPCGACLQVIGEFCGEGVVIEHFDGKNIKSWKFGELLPRTAFRLGS